MLENHGFSMQNKGLVNLGLKKIIFISQPEMSVFVSQDFHRESGTIFFPFSMP